MKRSWTLGLGWSQIGWLIVAGAAVIGFRASLLAWKPAVLLVAVACTGLVLTGFIGLLVLVVRLRRGRRDGSTPCLIATAIGLPALLSVLLIGLQGADAPPIHDISTDTTNPPLFQAIQNLRRAGDNSPDYPGANVAAQQQRAYPDIVPLEMPLPPEQAFARCLTVAERLRWELVSQDRTTGSIEAVDRSLLFGFSDDIVIRIEATGSGSRIDLRSASRAGISDLGVNAKRIRAFRAIFTTLSAK